MNKERAKEIVAKWQGVELLVVGDVMLDRYVKGDDSRENPEHNSPLLVAEDSFVATGGAGNTAKNAANLGANVKLLTVLGADAVADEVKDEAANEGYVIEAVIDVGRPSTEKRRYITRYHQLLRVDHEETRYIDGEVESEVASKFEEMAGKSQAIIVSDYAKGAVTEDLAKMILGVDVPVMADVKPQHVDWFKGVDYISPNRKEGREYLGVENGIGDNELAKKLREKFDTNVFLTLSEDGMCVHSEESAGVVVGQDHKIQVADTSGCGDTAAAVIMLAKATGASDREAAELANAAGAWVASHVGAQAPGAEELISMFEDVSS